MAGLCAARAIAPFVDRVTVVDRDAMPAGIEDRPGVPQSRHVHALLARGLRELDGLFPGFERKLRESGAVDVDFGMDFVVLRPFGWAPRVSLGLQLLFASRALFEGTLRALFRELPNVEILDRTNAIGLTTTDAGRRVSGVRVSSGDASRGTELAADLVVDASGRGSKAPEWLRAIGLEPPAETIVDSLAGYSTRWYAAPDRSRWPQGWWWKGIWLDPKIPEDLRAAVLFPVEGNRWIVTLGGLGGNYPPSDEEGFDQELRKLRSPILAEAVSLATPISGVYGNRAMANRFRHYERGPAVPGFVAVADSACAFNPVYGQGMTAAAICARVLEDCVRRHGAGAPELPARFFRAQSQAQLEFWQLATGADFMVPQTVGERTAASRLVVPYFKALLETAMDDTEVLRAFVEVINMIRPANSLFAPSTMARVGVGTVRRWLGGATPPNGAMPPLGIGEPAA